MEATFHSYLAEAIFAMEQQSEKQSRDEEAIKMASESAVLRGRKLSPMASNEETASDINHGLISYIDADSEDEDQPIRS